MNSEMLKAVVSGVDDVDDYLKTNIYELESPTHISQDMSPGELKDTLAELTSTYAFVSAMSAQAQFLYDHIEEYIGEVCNIASKTLQTPFKGTLTAAQRADQLREKKVAVKILKCEVKNMSIQELKYILIVTKYLVNHLSGALKTIDKSLSIGNTILAYSRRELEKMGLA